MTATEQGHPSQRATDWRMWVAPSGMMLCTLLSYIDRQVLAALSPTILKDTGLDAADYGTVVAAFSIAYTIANPLWGSILDYVGLRVGMLIAVTIWTVASASHAAVSGFIGFAAARALLGAGEGAAFPGALRTAIDALPVNRQARGTALGYSGASLGALITPIVAIPVGLRFGWQAAFLITGGLGVLWLALWASIAKPPYLPEHRRSKTVQWPNLLDRRLWVVAASFGLGAVALGVVAYLLPLYLNGALGVSQKDLAHILWIPMVGWEAGYFFWGWVADNYAANEPRPVRIFVLLTILALPSAFVTFTHSWAVVVALSFWATFVADGFVVMSLRVGSLIFSRDQTAMVAGIGSASWGASTALATFVYGRWFKAEWYTLTFVTMSLLPLLGTLLWLWLSKPWADHKIVTSERR